MPISHIPEITLKTLEERENIVLIRGKATDYDLEITDMRAFNGRLYVAVYRGMIYELDLDSLKLKLVRKFDTDYAFWNYYTSSLGNWWRRNYLPNITFVGTDSGGNTLIYSSDDGENWKELKLVNQRALRLGWWNYKWVLTTTLNIYMVGWDKLPAEMNPSTNKIRDNPYGLSLYTDYTTGKWALEDVVGIGRDNVNNVAVFARSSDGYNYSVVKTYTSDIVWHARDGGFENYAHRESTLNILDKYGWVSGSHLGAIVFFEEGTYDAEVIWEAGKPITLTISRKYSWMANYKFHVFGFGDHNRGSLGYLVILDYAENCIHSIRLPFSPSSAEIVGDEIWIGEAWRMSDFYYRIYRIKLRDIINSKPQPIAGYFREKGDPLKWKDKTINAGAYTSRIPAWRYEKKTIYFESDTDGNLTIEVDYAGDFNFKVYDTVSVSAGTPVKYRIEDEVKWVRLTFDTSARVTAMYNFR